MEAGVLASRFSSNIGAVGIDFGARGVKMLQLRQSRGELHVVGGARIAAGLAGREAGRRADDAQGLSAQIRAAFASGGFSGRRCVVSLPRAEVCMQSIRLPRMPDEELRQTAQWEAAQRFDLDRSEMEVDFIRTGAS